MTQQEFLRDAMRRLGMTREQFASRIGTNTHALNKWLQPSESQNFRHMTDVVWKFVGEILEREEK
ncbi:Aspartate carbamoyltransferase (plasmid) [Collimonas arenae]|uniref:Aspartate carbamoyltransferase n=1 Tax=Collimonas arenae TaxID=279058 RepID=A0A0A1FMP6_9BURK|nr:transcriptional regulator [Collimonas arenae]AIY44222.1 Aspartate carbamoyltransferase [Collimonas arenae]